MIDLNYYQVMLIHLIFLCNLTEMSHLNETDFKKHCNDLQIALTGGQEKDICAHNLYNEIQV